MLRTQEIGLRRESGVMDDVKDQIETAEHGTRGGRSTDTLLLRRCSCDMFGRLWRNAVVRRMSGYGTPSIGIRKLSARPCV